MSMQENTPAIKNPVLPDFVTTVDLEKFILTEHLRSECVFGQHSNTQEMEKERKRKHNL